MVRLVMAAIVGLLLAAPAHAATLSFEFSRDPSTLLPGDRLAVVLKTGPDADDLIGGMFDLHYDADVVAYLGAVFPNPPFNFTRDQRDRAVGAHGMTTVTGINFSAFFTGTGGGAHILATLMFEAIAPGSTRITITESGPGFGKGPVTFTPPRLDVTMPDPVDVVVTPIPAALPLFATGLIALGLVARRRSRQAA